MSTGAFINYAQKMTVPIGNKRLKNQAFPAFYDRILLVYSHFPSPSFYNSIVYYNYSEIINIPYHFLNNDTLFRIFLYK